MSLNSTFLKLKKEKQERIIIAGLIEFSQHGFEKASTNAIVNHAQIGKGMLFHYFNSKEEFFHDLVTLSFEFIESELIEKIDDSPTDFIDKCNRVVKTKMEAIHKNRHFFDFGGSLFLNHYQGLTQEQINHATTLQKKVANKMFENIENTPFRKDIAKETIIELIQWSIDGYQRKLINQLNSEELSNNSYEKEWDDFNVFLEVLKKIYYE